MDVIEFYDKDRPHFELSNYYPAAIYSYPTSEHYYQSMKYDYYGNTDVDDEYADQIAAQNTPNKARILAGQLIKGGYKWQLELNEIIRYYQELGIQIRTDWEDVKDNIMRRAVFLKFNVNPKLKQLLCNTGYSYLVEDSPRDSYWGVGKDKTGQNKLGQILMETRYILCGTYHTPAPSDRSNWVIPGHLLMAANPGRGLDDSGKKNNWKTDLATEYILSGVDTFISLQEEVPGNPYIPYQITGTVNINGITFRKYGKVWGYHLPIVDLGVTEDSSIIILAKTIIQLVAMNRRVMVHCAGGKGRAGTVISIILGMLYYLKPQTAMTLAQFVFDTREYKGSHPHIPQTEVQRDQVTRILNKEEDVLKDIQ
tara:strand:- start:236 stop:1339 length:1104 start_codon:yes stop_codon:yes gene_type:complete